MKTKFRYAFAVRFQYSTLQLTNKINSDVLLLLNRGRFYASVRVGCNYRFYKQICYHNKSRRNSWFDIADYRISYKDRIPLLHFRMSWKSVYPEKLCFYRTLLFWHPFFIFRYDVSCGFGTDITNLIHANNLRCDWMWWIFRTLGALHSLYFAESNDDKLVLTLYWCGWFLGWNGTRVEVHFTLLVSLHVRENMPGISLVTCSLYSSDGLSFQTWLYVCRRSTCS